MAKESSVSQIDENNRKQMQAEQEQIRQRVKRIKHQILVLSGKGGVGKSTVAVKLGSLARSVRQERWAARHRYTRPKHTEDSEP